MKRRINRETAIGLSVLLLLLVILVGVAALRGMRPNLPSEAIVAREEAKHEEECFDHRSQREAESLHKSDLLTPVAAAHRDSLQALDDPGHRNNAAIEAELAPWARRDPLACRWPGWAATAASPSWRADPDRGDRRLAPVPRRPRVHVLHRAGAVGVLLRRADPPRQHHQGRPGAGPHHADRGGLGLPACPGDRGHPAPPGRPARTRAPWPCPGRRSGG